MNVAYIQFLKVIVVRIKSFFCQQPFTWNICIASSIQFLIVLSRCQYYLQHFFLLFTLTFNNTGYTVKTCAIETCV
jgi:hypothetical protein